MEETYERFRISRYVLLAIIEPTLVVFSILFVLFRKRYIIRLRYPQLVYLTNIWIIIQTMHSLIEDQPCWIYNIVRWLMIPILANGILLRCWYTLRRFQEQDKITQEIKSNKEFDISQINQKVSKFQRFLAGRDLVAVFLIFGAIWIVILIGLSFGATNFWNSETVVDTLTDECRLGRMRYVTSISAALYGIVMIIIAIKMRKVKESLKLLLELKICGVAGIIASLSSGILSLIRDIRLRRDVYSLITEFTFIAVFTATTIIPVITAWKLKDLDSETDSSSNTSSPQPASRSLTERSYEITLDKLTLKQVIEDKTLLDDFRKFLKLEFCVENIMFIEAVKEHKGLPEDQRKKSALKIIKLFIGTKGRFPINISGESRTTIERRIETDSVVDLLTIFDSAYGQVYHMLKNDSFPRFIKSLTPASDSADIETSPERERELEVV